MSTLVVAGHVPALPVQLVGQRGMAADVLAQAVHQQHGAAGRARCGPASQVQRQSVVGAQCKHVAAV
ncbi:hypothetical protein [Aquincola sp. J276]|uniref:hypothetical protein n=1 Tax=Aquincola sp. J276 TaxID=2898432 RepID=UPI002150CD14|nr:hypothetical protein [Aquincola sp. J276]MCR5866543.1 hypothetical protein [Aquincola sp. J276]